jgi:tetratricopeptide (TPR) repeat protein
MTRKYNSDFCLKFNYSGIRSGIGSGIGVDLVALAQIITSFHLAPHKMYRRKLYLLCLTTSTFIWIILSDFTRCSSAIKRSLIDSTSFVVRHEYLQILDQISTRKPIIQELLSRLEAIERYFVADHQYDSIGKIVQYIDISGRHDLLAIFRSRVSVEGGFDESISLQKGVQHHFSGDYLAAIDTYERILKDNPRNADAWFHLGVSQQHSGSIEEAAFSYSSCLNIDPIHVKSRLNLASLHHQYGSIDEALIHYGNALQSFVGHHIATLPVEYTMVKLNYGIALFQQGRHDEVR